MIANTLKTVLIFGFQIGKKTGWITSSKKPVKNVDLWKPLDELVAIHEITWVWVKGHAGNAGNERADALANKGVPLK